MTPQNGPPILAYGSATPSTHWSVKLALRFASWVVVVSLMFVAAILLPHPTGIWYFGRRPQWLIAIDSAGLTIGPADTAFRAIGWWPVLTAKMFVYALPTWLIWRFAIRRLWRRRAARRRINPG